MRRVAWALLLVYVFTIPWEYSLDFGAPWGNVARLVGLLVVAAAVLAVMSDGHLRRPCALQMAIGFYFLWLALSCYWSIDTAASFGNLRGYIQEMMIVYLLWEFADSPADLLALLRAYVMGSWVLALLCVGALGMSGGVELQVRFTAPGQDPNDVARYLNFAFPLSVLLLIAERSRAGRLLAIGYLPVGLAAVVLSGSRGGAVAALVALCGCGILLAISRRRALLFGAVTLTSIMAWVWYAVPRQTLARLATIGEQLQGGDLNQRLQIWHVGWQAFLRAPLIGQGAGTFVAASGLAPIDTAHNTALSLAVTTGLVGVFLGSVIVVLTAWMALELPGLQRIAFLSVLAVWLLTSMVATVEENRTTWLLFGLVAVTARIAGEDREGVAAHFGPGANRVESCLAEP